MVTSDYASFLIDPLPITRESDNTRVAPMKAVSALLWFPLLAVPLSGAEAQRLRPVGSTVAVINLVTAEYNRDTRTLQRGDDVHQDETIEVGLDGSSELKLNDDTKLALGPGSNLTLDKFVYDPDKAKGSIVVNLIKGAFRFMTGVAEKPTYVIKTPAAAITVRGTIFDVFVQRNGPTWVLLHEGAVQVRSTSGVCKDLYEPGKLIRIDNGGGVGAPVRWASLPGNDATPFNDAFPFVTKVPSIDPEPVLTRDVIMTGTLPVASRPAGDNCDDDDTIEPAPPTKPKYKKAKPTYEEKPKYEKIKRRPKKEYKEKQRQADKDKVIRGVGTAIGIGVIVGGMKYKGNKGSGPYGGGGHRPGGGSTGGGYGGGGYGGRGR